MPDTQEQRQVAEIAASLRHRAAELWGEERAQAIAPELELAAQSIHRISVDPPPADEEPAFYF